MMIQETGPVSDEHLMLWPPACSYCSFFFQLLQSSSGGAVLQDDKWARGGDLITWSPRGVKTAAGRLRQTADNKTKVVCGWLQTTAFSFMLLLLNVISCSLTWAAQSYLKGTPASAYSCIHTSSVGNYLMSHCIGSCVQQVPGPCWRTHQDPVPLSLQKSPITR